MPSTRARAAIGVLAATTIAVGGVLSGCSLKRDEEPRAATSTQAPDPVESPTEEPTSDPTPSAPAASPTAPTPSPSPAISAAASPQDALLTAAELPQLNDTAAWTVRRTGPIGSDPFGRCQEFDLLSIGATTAVERSFTHEEDTAAQVVAEFPDAQNATRAGKVLESWHRDCAERVRGRNVTLSPITPVPVAAGTAWWYLLRHATPQDGHFHSFGVLRSGSRMTLVQMDHDGQDHNYEAGADPMELALRAAAGKLG